MVVDRNKVPFETVSNNDLLVNSLIMTMTIMM